MNPKIWSSLLCTCTALCALACPGAVYADAIRSGFNGNTLAANDDESTGAVALGFTANFFGNSRTQVFVNNNGTVSFDSAMNAYTPYSLGQVNQAVIAPFFADVDTRSGNVVSYGTGSVDGHAAFGANWLDVGYFAQKNDKTNRFQALLVDRSDTGAGNFDIELNYGQIKWESGDASGGTNGLGGESARAGFSKGTGEGGTYYELPGSGTPGAFLDDNNSSGLIFGQLNSDVAGRYVLQAREGTVTPNNPNPMDLPPPVPDGGNPGGIPVGNQAGGPGRPNDTPEPGTLTLFGVALITVAGVKWGRRSRRIAN